MSPAPVRGLLLTGGGARGAYQAGVLMGIAKLIGDPEDFPFPVLTGMSAGAINTVGLAGMAGGFAAAAKRLGELWGSLEMNQVFHTDVARLAQVGADWFRKLALGGFLGHGDLKPLLDTRPLRRLLDRTLDFAAMRGQLAARNIRGVALQATHYGAGASVTFVEAGTPGVTWTRARRIALRAVLTTDHVMASTAIPIVFPAVRIGGGYFFDGSVRSTSPFSPAIHLGADRILAVSVRKQQIAQTSLDAPDRSEWKKPTLGGIFGSLLNALFLEAVDGDLERLNRINHTLELISPQASQRLIGLRHIEALMISPSEDLAALAMPHLRHFPATLRYFLRGLGADQPESSDLLSYILFHRGYCRELIELGIQDVRRQETKLNHFFR